jgi:arylsulfatase A-like enzyme
VRGTISAKLYHVTDWLPTIVALCGGDTSENLPLDGYNIWPSLTSSAPSERTEILLNINPACHNNGYVNPNAGIRLGDWKLLVDCFNTTTLQPTNGDVELYNIQNDPYETNDVAAKHTAKVKELLARLSVYAQSKDQAKGGGGERGGRGRERERGGGGGVM